MRYRIDLAHVRRSVPRIARTQLRRAHAALANDTGPIDERVHAARTALKRTRALIQLVEGQLPKRTARRQIRRLRNVARELSGPRDAHVVVLTFDELVSRLDAGVQASCRPLRARLVRGGTGGGTALDASLRRGVRGLARAVKQSKRLLLRDGGFRAVIPGLEAGYRRARRAMRTAFRAGDDESFHTFRKAVKAHGHHVRLIEDAWAEGLGPRVAGIAMLDECLGRDHDLALLRAKVLERNEIGGSVRAALLEAIGARRNELRTQARRLADELFGWKARRFAKEVARRQKRAAQASSATPNDVLRSAVPPSEERMLH